MHQGIQKDICLWYARPVLPCRMKLPLLFLGIGVGSSGLGLCLVCPCPGNGFRHWSDMQDRLFPVASAALLLSQGKMLGQVFCPDSFLNYERHGLSPEPLAKTPTPSPRERLTLYLTGSRERLECQQRQTSRRDPWVTSVEKGRCPWMVEELAKLSL